MSKEKTTVPVSIYPEKELLDWIDNEAAHDHRSRTAQIEYFLEESRRVREHNRKAMTRQA